MDSYRITSSINKIVCGIILFLLLKHINPMHSYSHCLEIVEKGISEFKLNQNPVELFEPIKYTLSNGGKRIRPCLALMVHSIYSDNLDEALEPALGIEVFHNFTLLHDDIMDNASLRRNRQTIHVKWGHNAAILSGDAMMILAYHLISKSQVAILPRVMELFNQTALEVCEGQQLDMNYEKQERVSEEEYMGMIRLKTASLLAASAALGGLTGKAPEGEIEKLYQLGLNIGIAFQLQDDYLDVFAEKDAFGKNIGGDIVANKKTFLLISALNSRETNLVNSLKTWIGLKEFDADEKIEAVTAIYRQLGVDIKNRELSNTFFEKGLFCLDQLKAENLRKAELKKLILSIMQREH
jgi:geranylgeranyl diphosphate synthase type II